MPLMEYPETEPERAINIPEHELTKPPLTKAEIEEEARRRVSRISKEFAQGFEFIKGHPRSVTFFGSARFTEGHPYYEKARRLAYKLSKEGFAIVTGGGPGIMEAANRGAAEAGGPSLGLNIRLPREQAANPYVTEAVDFWYFFSRKVSLSFSAEAYIYFPGGFGTLDEFFEILTLVQTRKIPQVPIILVGWEYWGAFNTFIEKHILQEYRAISEKDMDLYTVTEDDDEVIKIAKEAPLRKE